MTPSREVQDAVGTVPERGQEQQSATALLADKQQALAEAEAKLADAEARLDEQAVGKWSQRAETLRGFIHRLRDLAREELEQDAEAQARRWLAEYATREVHTNIAMVQADVRRHLAAFVHAVEVEAKWRHASDREALAVEILTARFPALAAMANPVPPVENYLRVCLDATDALPLPRGRVLHPVVRAKDRGTPEEAKAKQRAVEQFLQKRGAQELPEAVWRLLQAAPKPPDAAREAETEDVKTREQRAEKLAKLRELTGGKP